MLEGLPSNKELSNKELILLADSVGNNWGKTWRQSGAKLANQLANQLANNDENGNGTRKLDQVLDA